MDYEKAYKDALERAKKYWNSPRTCVDIEVIPEIFPELKESEDERIRGAIMHFISHTPTVPKGIINKEQMLAWLEKQGEHANFRNKIQIGDKVTRNEAGILVNISQPNRIAKLRVAKSADKIASIDEFAGLTDFERTLADICIGWIGKEIGWKQYIKNNADALLQIAVEKFNSVQDATFERKHATIDIDKMVNDYANNKERGNEEFGKPVNCMIRAYRQGLNDAIRKVVLKHSWSEEDEVRIRQICGDLKCGLENFLSGKNVKGLHFEEIIKSNIDWLKSLKDKYTWKPSKEQMTALSEASGIVGMLTPRGTNLQSLYNDLKKLTE
jgi:hypothetical protein